MDNHNSLRAIECYKNLSRHGICSKFNFAITQDNYKKSRTVCKLCYNNHVFAYCKNKFCSNSSPKSDVGTQTDFSDKQEGLNKKVGSSKKIAQINRIDQINEINLVNMKVRINKGSSSKQDISTNYLIDDDPM